MSGDGWGRVDRRGGGRREMPVVGVHDSFLKNSSQKRGWRWRWAAHIIQIRFL